MIPLKLSLQGFLSYKELVSVDLSQIKVACVSGQNGAGKSTLFDAITWSLFGRARRNDDALIHNNAEICQVIFTFAYEGNRYRVDRAKQRGKSTTLEFHVKTPQDTWQSFTEAGMRATEKRIQDVLGLDYDTFVNASFFLQGKADMFSVQPPSKRKEILTNILGLTVWDTYHDETASRRREAQKQLSIHQSLLKEVVEELDEEGARKERLAHAKEILEIKAKLRESKEQLLETAQIENAQIESDKEKLGMLSAQRTELETSIAAGREKIDSRKSELQNYAEVLLQEKEIIQSHQAFQQVRDQLTALNAVGMQYNRLVVEKAELEGKLRSEKARLEQELQNLRSQKSEISTLERNQQKLTVEVQALEQESDQLQTEMKKVEKLEETQVSRKNLQSEKEAENSQLRIKMEEIKERRDHLEQTKGPDCPLCGQELTASHKEKLLAKIEAEGKALGDQFRENVDVINTCKDEIQKINLKINKLHALHPHLTDVMGQAGALRQQLEESTKKIDQWKQQGAQRLKEVMDRLDNSTFAIDLRPLLEEIEHSIKKLDYSSEQHEALRKKEIELREFENKFRYLEQARTAQQGLEREIKELEQQQATSQKNHDQLTHAIEKLSVTIKEKEEKNINPAQLERELHEARMEENQSRQDVGSAQQMVNVLEKLRERKKDLESQSKHTSRQIARLKMLETAFGKDGVPALLIENAIPQIETQANEILDKLSGGSMSVSFETEREYADKKREDRRQTLDIIIRDSAGSRAYELFSGGEAFRINFAIRLALSRVLAQRSGARLQTLVIDEGFGSQDAEGRQRLVEAINMVKNDFEKILVITHLDELKDAFSSRIEVSKSPRGSQVEVIV